MTNSNKMFFALDLEMNQPSRKIIQIGLAVGCVEQGVTLTKSWIINPQELIHPDITALTGIDNLMISNQAVPHAQAAKEISEILTSLENLFVNPVVWGGGDSAILLNEFAQRDIEFRHFGRRWFDVKTLYVFEQLATGKSGSGGLASAMGRYKMPFKGKAHRADVDAQNTLEFFFLLIKRQQTVSAMLKSASELN